jgi:hypothetical protein
MNAVQHCRTAPWLAGALTRPGRGRKQPPNSAIFGGWELANDGYA